MLSDFGFARFFADELSTQSPAGSPAYMAPEAWGAKRTFAADIWSAGIVLYELTYGQRPFTSRDGSLDSLKLAICESPHSHVVTACPSALRQVIDRALSKEAGKRFETASRMRAALIDATETTDQIRPASTDARLVIVRSDTDATGALISYRIDGQEVALSAEETLSISLAPGEHTIQCFMQGFRQCGIKQASGFDYLGRSEPVVGHFVEGRTYSVDVVTDGVKERVTSAYRALFRLAGRALGASAPVYGDERTYPASIRVMLRDG